MYFRKHSNSSRPRCFVWPMLKSSEGSFVIEVYPSEVSSHRAAINNPVHSTLLTTFVYMYEYLQRCRRYSMFAHYVRIALLWSVFRLLSIYHRLVDSSLSHVLFRHLSPSQSPKGLALRPEFYPIYWLRSYAYVQRWRRYPVLLTTSAQRCCLRVSSSVCIPPCGDPSFGNRAWATFRHFSRFQVRSKY